MNEETRDMVVLPMMPGANGGMLRRGGAGPGLTKERAQFYQILRDKTPDLARKLIATAMKGNINALTLALAYAIGKPTDKIELSGPDGGPLAFSVAESDHEKRLLRDAIMRELEREEVPA